MTIDQGLYLDIAGRRQWVAVRGRDASNPALMFVGGAGAGFAGIAPFFAPWEDDFTLIHWDQPGGGYTGGAPVSYSELAAQCAHVAEGVTWRFRLGSRCCSPPPAGRSPACRRRRRGPTCSAPMWGPARW
jgi:pimeloyl-ACP methyl ester carboxylesterase